MQTISLNYSVLYATLHGIVCYTIRPNVASDLVLQQQYLVELNLRSVSKSTTRPSRPPTTLGIVARAASTQTHLHSDTQPTHIVTSTVLYVCPGDSGAPS